MICESCGASYDDAMLLCPYCGTENPAHAAREQQEYMAQYEEKIRGLEEVPEHLAKKASRHVSRAVCVAAVSFLAVLVIVCVAAGIRASGALDRQQRQLQKLEEYYQAGEYHEMAEYLEEIEGKGASFEKYTQVSDMLERYDWTKEFVEEYQDEIDVCLEEEDTGRALHLASVDLSACFEQLRSIRGLEEDGFPCGNETGMRDISGWYRELLGSTYLLTGEEIEEGISRYRDSETDYTDMAETALQRRLENGAGSRSGGSL